MCIVLFPMGSAAFTSLSTSKRTLFVGANTLYGKSRIRRVGPRKDGTDRIASFVNQGKDNIQENEIEISTMSLDELLLPSSDCDVNQIGPTALAYLGDVVFELMVRARHVWPTRRTSDLQQQVVALVRGVLDCVVVTCLRV